MKLSLTKLNTYNPYCKHAIVNKHLSNLSMFK